MRNVGWLAVGLLLAGRTALAVDLPAVQWERTFQSYDTCCAWAEQTEDGGFVAAGREKPSWDETSIYLLRTDSLGNTLWQRSFDAGGTDFAKSARQTSDRGFVLAGRGGDSGQAVVLKLDSFGNQQWLFKRFGSATIYDVQQTTDGGYITGGLWRKRDSLYLLKLDSSGNPVWRKSYDEYYGHWSARVPVQQTGDGGYIMAAKVLLKTDSLGNRVWKRKYSDVFVMFSVQQTADGGFVATGIARAGWPLGYLKVFNMVLLKTDPQGNLQWKRVFTEGSESEGRCVGQTSDGGYVIGGDVTEGGIDYGRIVRTDSLGNALWTKTLCPRTGVTYCQQTTDGGYILGDGGIRIWKLAPEQ